MDIHSKKKVKHVVCHLEREANARWIHLTQTRMNVGVVWRFGQNEAINEESFLPFYL